jgi:hypothetical protein
MAGHREGFAFRHRLPQGRVLHPPVRDPLVAERHDRARPAVAPQGRQAAAGRGPAAAPLGVHGDGVQPLLPADGGQTRRGGQAHQVPRRSGPVCRVAPPSFRPPLSGQRSAPEGPGAEVLHASVLQAALPFDELHIWELRVPSAHGRPSCHTVRAPPQSDGAVESLPDTSWQKRLRRLVASIHPPPPRRNSGRPTRTRTGCRGPSCRPRTAGSVRTSGPSRAAWGPAPAG